MQQVFTCCANFFCHLDSSSMEVNLWVVLVEPGHPKDHALLPKPCNRKQNAFGVAVVCHDHVNDFADASSFIQPSGKIP